LPEDFVSLVKVSWIDEYGRIHPMIQNKRNIIGTAYLQDQDANYTFDNDGNLQQADSIAEQRSYIATQKQIDYDSLEDEHTGGRFGMNTADANKNGTYILEKNQGFIRFSSHLQDGDIVVIKYNSDGLFSKDDTTIKVNKLAEDFMYSYIQSEILNGKFGVQEYIVRRAKKEASAKLRNAKIRLMNINIDDLIQNLRGKDKWIK